MIAIIKATILDLIRDRRNTFFYIFFPVFLVFLLGNILSGTFSESASNDKQVLKVCYVDEGTASSKQIFEKFKDIAKDNDTYKLDFIKENSLSKAKDKVRKQKNILIHLNNDKVDIYSNSESITRTSYVYSVINSINKTTSAVATMYKIDPKGAAQQVKNITQDNSSKYFSIERIPYNRVADSMGYYGVAEIGLMIFYFIIMPLYTLRNNKEDNIEDRIKISGISRTKYYMSVFIANVLFFEVCTTITYLICKFVIGVNYGSNIFILPLAALPFISMIVALGILLASLVKKREDIGLINNVIQIIIILMSFVGGGYIAVIGEDDGLLSTVGKISPLKWFNKSIFDSVYSSDNTTLYGFFAAGMIITVILCIGIVAASRREESANA